MIITIINGPNLNMLGTRETTIYGNKTFEAFLENLKQQFTNITFEYFQSNIEGEIINALQACNSDGIILNAAAYSHTSIAIADAIKTIQVPVVEVHISNIHAREDFRKHSLTAIACIGVITGFGLDSYMLGVQALQLHLKK
jgi:3-dehydroquinate dehydratase II